MSVCLENIKVNQIILKSESEKTIVLSRSKIDKNIVFFDNIEYNCPHWRKFHTLCYFTKSIEKICFVKIAGISAPDGNYYRLMCNHES